MASPLISNVIIPIIKTTFFVGMIVWLLWIIYWVASKVITPRRWVWIRYKIFRKPVSEKDVRWVDKAQSNGWSERKVQKYLLLHGTSFHRVEEILYLYRELRQLKGGVEHDKHQRHRSEDQLPEI